MRERYWLAIAAALIVLYLSPLLVLGENAHVRVHDNLDSNVVWYKILAESNQEFAASNAEVPNMMNGLPRVSLGSEFKLYVLLFNWFDPFTAYTINAVLMRFAAFIGMYWLLKRHLFKDGRPLIPVGVALCFSLLPFWPFGALSIAGLPLALFAFLNFRNRDASLKDWLIVILLPFYSSLILTFVFFLGMMSVLWLYDVIRSRRPNWLMLWAIALMAALYLVKLYRLIKGFLLGYGFTPHREEFSLGHNGFADTLRLFVENFTTAHTHSYTLQYYVIIYVAVIALSLIFVAAFRRSGSLKQYLQNDGHASLLIFSGVLAALFSLWYAFWYWEGMRVLKNAFSLFNTFNLSRIHFFNAVLWYLIFAFALKIVGDRVRFGKTVVGILLVCQMGVLFAHNHEIKYRNLGMPSYEQFYSEQLFSNIKSFIGKKPENYRVVSIGMHPAVPQYNGFYTIDLYITMYPLEYKHRFRGIINEELQKNSTLKKYFHTWGGRCYVFVDELGKHYMYTKKKNKTVHNLELGTQRLKQMGGDYVLSAVKIENAKENGLILLKVFENDHSVWRIRLYKIM